MVSGIPRVILSGVLQVRIIARLHKQFCVAFYELGITKFSFLNTWLIQSAL